MSWYDYRGKQPERKFFTFPQPNEEDHVKKSDFNPYLKKVGNWLYPAWCRENEIQIYLNLDERKYYHTRRWSSNDSPNGTGNLVLGAHLLMHIAYNQVMRFGQALFIDGKCVALGYKGVDWCKAKEEEWKNNPPPMPKHHIPYD